MSALESQTAGSESYLIGDQNRVLAAGQTRFIYDNEGNRISKYADTNGNGALDSGELEQTYEWDHRNRLIRSTQYEYGFSGGPAVLQVDYRYNASDQMVSRVTTDLLNSPGTQNGYTKTRAYTARTSAEFFRS
jgi:hypothetical protein